MTCKDLSLECFTAVSQSVAGSPCAPCSSPTFKISDAPGHMRSCNQLHKEQPEPCAPQTILLAHFDWLLERSSAFTRTEEKLICRVVARPAGDFPLKALKRPISVWQ